MALLRHADCIERCPLSRITRKTFAQAEFFRVWPICDIGRSTSCACQVPFPARHPLKSPEPVLSMKKCSRRPREGADFILKTKTRTARCERLSVFHRA